MLVGGAALLIDSPEQRILRLPKKRLSHVFKAQSSKLNFQKKKMEGSGPPTICFSLTQKRANVM